MEIIVKKWEHYNRALGKHISSKRQYKEEMARGGYVPYEQGEQMAKDAQERLKKPYDGLSPKARAVIATAKLNKDKDGNVKLSDRTVDAMKEIGMKFSLPDWCPKAYKEEGGFNDKQ